MPIQVVYPQTLIIVSPGDAFGHLVVNDASALVVGAEGYLYHQTKDPIFVKVVDITGNTLTVTFNSLVLDTSAYGPQSGADIHFDHQAVDSTVVPPAPGVGINIAAGTNTATSGTVSFVNSNGVTFGLDTNNAMTVSVVPGAAAGVGAAAAGSQTMTSGTLAFANSNNVSFTMNGSSQIVASASFAGANATVFSNSNNVTFGLNGSTVTATATWPAQSNQPVAVSGSNGSFNFSTLSMGNSNGMTFYTTNGSVVGSYTVPTIPGATVFSNSNNVTFGLNGSTVTASATVTYPAQTVQPVAASASNGSFNFSTLKFIETNGVTFATSTDGIRASVKTDYQTSNANYLTSQSNQAVSGSNGSFAFQTLTMGNSNGMTFYTTNGSMVGSYTVPVIPGATVFSNSNNVTFGLNGSTVTATATFPAQTVQPVAASASNGSFNFSTLKFIETNGVTFATSTDGIRASVKTDYQSSNANYLTSQSNQAVSGTNGSVTFQTLSFTAANGASFYTSNNSAIALSYTVPSVPAQTQQPMYFSAGTTSTSANTISFGTSAANGNVTFAISNGSLVGSAPSGGAGFTAGISTNGSGTTGTVNSQIVFFPGANITLSQSVNGGSASLTMIGGAGGAFSAGNSTNGSGTTGLVGAQIAFFPGANITLSQSINGQSASLSVIGGAGGAGAALKGSGTYTQNTGTIEFANSNNVTFGLSNNGTMTASASFNQSVQPVAASGSNGSFAFSTLTMGNSNGLTFYTTNGSMVGSYTVPTVPGATVFSNSNNVTFGLNGSTVTATATFPAQTVQPVAASASNGSYNFSTIKFVEGSGVTWATQANGIQASVKTDYQSSNANYLTSQSNQAVSGTNGSVTFQTLSFTAANGASFYTSNNSAIALSYTVPNVPAQTQQPMYFSAGTTSTSANTLQFGTSAANGNVTFAISGGSVVGSVPTTHSASAISVQSVGTAAAYKDLQVIHNVARAAGHLNGGEITDAGGGSINVATGQGFVRGSADDISTLYTFDWPAPSALAVPNNTIRYVVVEYNAGTPRVVLYTSESYDYQTTFPLGFVVNESGTLYINATPHSTGRSSGRIMRRNYEVDGRSRANTLGGLIISESGTRNLSITTGTTWLRGIRDIFPGLDTNVTGSFDRYYRDGGTGWTKEAAQTQTPNDNYDDNSGTLAALGVNNFGVRWFFLGPSNGIIMVYGRADHNTLAQAEAEGLPADLPLRIQVGSLLIGRIVYKKNGASAASVSSAFVDNYVGSAAGDHGSLAGLADDDHLQYHLRSEGVIRQIAAGGVSATSGSIQFNNSNGMSFGLNAGTVTASYAHSGPTGVVVNASASTITAGNVVFSNSNNVTFGINGSTITASAAAGGANFSAGNSTDGVGTTGLVGSQIVFFEGANITLSQSINGGSASLSIIGGAGGAGAALKGSGTYTQNTGTIEFANSNNVTFGLSNNGTMTASASFNQSVQPVVVSGSNGSFAFSTLTLGSSNGMHFYSTNGSIVGSYTVPGATVFSNSNNVTFGLNASTVTADVQMRASASNGSYLNSHIKFVEGSGVTWATQAGGIQASVKTDYQSSNANYLTSQSNQAVSGTNGSVTFQTLSFTAANGASFYTSNNSAIALSYTVPNVPAQTQQPMYFSAGTTSSSANTLQFGTSAANGNVTFAVSGGSIVGSAPSGGGGIGGIVAGTSASTQTSGTLAFVNSNEISFGWTNGSQVTASFARSEVSAGNNISLSTNGSTMTINAQAVAIAVSNTTNTSGTVAFVNSNNVSFGWTNGSQITASASFAGGGIGGIIAGTSASTQTSGSLNLVNSNGISFGWSNGTQVTADAHLSMYATGNTTQSSTGTAGLNSIIFNGAGNVSVGVSGGSVVISGAGGGNFSAGNSTDGVGTTGVVGSQIVFFEGANITLSQSINGGSASLSIIGGAGGAGAALKGSGTYTQNTGTIEFANSNDVTFGLSNNGTMTASFGRTANIYAIGNTTGQSSSTSYDNRSLYMSGAGNISIGNSGGTFIISQTGGGGGAALKGSGTYTQNTGTIEFANSNGMTFGLSNNGTMTASYDVSQLTVGGNISLSNNGSTITLNGQAVAMAFNAATTQTSGTVVFSNSNGLSWGYNVNTVTAQLTRNISAIGNTTGQSSSSSYNGSAQSFSGAGGISLGNSGGAFIISAPNSTYNVSAVGNTTGQSSSSSYAYSAHVFSGAGNISVGNSGGSIIISATGGGGGAAISADGTAAAGSNSQNTGTVKFANSNNVTFGLSNNGIMTASFNAANTASTFQAGISTFGNTDGTTGLVQNNIVFVGTNGVSLSQSINGQSATLTIDGAVGGGAGYTAFTYNNRQMGASTNATVLNNAVWLAPMRIGAPVSASTAMMIFSITGTPTSNQTHTVGITLQAALYKYTGGTNISRMDTVWSTQETGRYWNSGTVSQSMAWNTYTTSSASSAAFNSSVMGLRMLTFAIGSTLDTGLYAWGYKLSTASTGGSSILRSFNHVIDNPMPVGMQVGFGATTATSIGYVDAGSYATTTAAIPATFELSQIRQHSNYVPYVKIGAI